MDVGVFLDLSIDYHILSKGINHCNSKGIIVSDNMSYQPTVEGKTVVMPINTLRWAERQSIGDLNACQLPK